MPETKTVGSQKITTYYDEDKEAEREESARATGGSERHTERRKLNLELKEKGVAPKGSIFQRIADVAAPGLAGEARALGKKGVKKLVAGGIVTGVQNVGARVGQLSQVSGPPVWLQDVRQGKRTKKFTQVPGEGLPAWVFGGHMPWDAPTQKTSDVERIIVTRVHSDGRKTRTVRKPRHMEPMPTMPEWIRF